jgi:hypothetical protein
LAEGIYVLDASEISSEMPHHSLALVSLGDIRLKHRAKADQYDRLSGARDLFRKAG